jgi:hypothetical protein
MDEAEHCTRKMFISNGRKLTWGRRNICLPYDKKILVLNLMKRARIGC